MLIPKKITGAKRFFLASLLIIVIGTIIFIIYNHFFKDDLAIKRGQKYGVGNTEIFQAPEVDTTINANILNSKPYSDFVQYGKLPITPPRAGRDNPFQRIIFSQ